jgi:RimJ/RimL family protein N-acetyltransferase
MAFMLKETSPEELLSIINKADQDSAFLPNRDEPNFKVSDLLMNLMHEKDFHIFAFADEMNIVGFISILPNNEEEALAIGPMYILKEYQGLGLGKKQVVELVEWAKCKQTRKIYTRTWGQNRRSRKIFECLGFILIAENPGQRINGDSTFKYVLNIT